MSCYSGKYAVPLNEKDKQNLDAYINNPKNRAKLILFLSSPETNNLPEEEKLAFTALVRILTSNKINTRTIVTVIDKLAVEKGIEFTIEKGKKFAIEKGKEFAIEKGKEFVLQEFCLEAGLHSIDPAGILGAFRILKALAQGDYKKAGKIILFMCVMKVVAGVVIAVIPIAVVLNC